MGDFNCAPTAPRGENCAPRWLGRGAVAGRGLGGVFEGRRLGWAAPLEAVQVLRARRVWRAVPKRESFAANGGLALTPVKGLDREEQARATDNA